MRIIPSTALLKCDTLASKDIKCTTNRKIDPTSTQPVHEFQILDVSSATCIRDRKRADLREIADELFVNAGL